MQYFLSARCKNASIISLLSFHRRLAGYVDWLEENVATLESDFLSSASFGGHHRRRRPNANDEFEGYSEDHIIDEDDESPCAQGPCGENAVCWNSGKLERHF